VAELYSSILGNSAIENDAQQNEGLVVRLNLAY
jgi:hypothetical protein